MAKPAAFYSRADGDYFGGAYRYIRVGSTEKKIGKTCGGAEVTKGLAIHGSGADGARAAVEDWV